MCINNLFNDSNDTLMWILLLIIVALGCGGNDGYGYDTYAGRNARCACGNCGCGRTARNTCGCDDDFNDCGCVR